MFSFWILSIFLFVLVSDVTFHAEREKFIVYQIVFSLEYLMVLYILYLILFSQNIFQKFGIVPLGS